MEFGHNDHNGKSEWVEMELIRMFQMVWRKENIHTHYIKIVKLVLNRMSLF